MTKLPLFFAQAAPAPSAPVSSTFAMIGYVLLLGGMFWFMTASQRKQKKEQEKMLSALKAGDEVLTAGGIYGTITSVKEDRFVVRVSDGQKLEVGKSFIHSCVKQAGAA